MGQTNCSSKFDRQCKTDASRRSSTVKFSKKRFSPMFAAAWVPNTGMVVYGNYMQDLEPGATNEDTGEMSKPRVSKQIEMGVRKNWGDVVTSLKRFPNRPSGLLA